MTSLSVEMHKLLFKTGSNKYLVSSVNNDYDATMKVPSPRLHWENG